MTSYAGSRTSMFHQSQTVMVRWAWWAPSKKDQSISVCLIVSCCWWRRVRFSIAFREYESYLMRLNPISWVRILFYEFESDLVSLNSFDPFFHSLRCAVLVTTAASPDQKRPQSWKACLLIAVICGQIASLNVTRAF